MNKSKKIIAGAILSTMALASVAFAGNDNVSNDAFPKLPKGPVYQIINEISEFKLDLSLEDIKSHILAGDLKETLEAEGVDVEGLQVKFREKANEVLEENGIEAKIVHTEDGAQLQLSSDNNQRFLNRIGIMQARADYFNQNHEDAPFYLSAEKDGNTIYLNVHGESDEAVAKIQDRVFESK